MPDEQGPRFTIFRGGRAKPIPGASEITFTLDEGEHPSEDAAQTNAAEELRVRFEWLLQHCENVIILGVMGGKLLDYQALDPEPMRLAGALVMASNAIALESLLNPE